MATLTFPGGARTVTGSKHLLEVAGARILYGAVASSPSPFGKKVAIGKGLDVEFINAGHLLGSW